MVYRVIPALREEDCEFKASLGYMVSFYLICATWRDLVSKKKKKRKNKTQKPTNKNSKKKKITKILKGPSSVEEKLNI
jgi:hypothetical protein